MTTKEVDQCATTVLIEHVHNMRHDYINYLHNIMIMLQMKRNYKNVLEYIENLAISLKSLSKIYALSDIENLVGLAEISMNLINGGFELEIKDLDVLNSQPDRWIIDTTSFNDYYQTLNAYIDYIEVDDLMCIMQMSEERNLYLNLHFPYIHSEDLYLQLRAQLHAGDEIHADLAQGLNLFLLISVRDGDQTKHVNSCE